MRRSKIIIIALALILSAILLSGCGKGVQLDENEVIEGNGSERLVKEGTVYSYENGTIEKDGAEFAKIETAKDDKLFALGEYLYANTSDGAVQIRISDAKDSARGRYWRQREDGYIISRTRAK